MLRSGHGILARWLAAFLCIGILSWLALEYLVPSPPSRITLATGPKGSTFEYFGRRYRARFARVGIDLELRQTVGALENLQLLQDPKSGVEIGFVTGGISDGGQAPELLSTGLIYNVPFWIFYPSSTTLDGLPQLKGKRIAVGPEGSGTRFTAERILSKANVTAKTATLVPLEGNAAIEALDDGKVDAVLIVGGSDAPAVRALLTNPHIRVMDFPTAEAFTRIFPDLVRLVLPKGAIEIDPPNPPDDVTLVGTTAKVLIRDNLHPAVVQLLARTMKEEHSGLGLFQRSGEFPSSFDPEYPMAQVAVDYYKNGPSFLAKYLPFWMTIYAQRLIAFSVAAVAIVFPAFSFAPRLYEWILHTRLRTLYRRLRVVENALHMNLSTPQIEALQKELADIDKATSTVPMRNSDLYFMLRYHLNQTRTRLAEAGDKAKVGQNGC
jgi:TRAP-type uncharacterized transport system substrate-binding protein